MSNFDPKTERRTIELLDAAVENALRESAPQDLLLDRLVAPIVASTECASSKCCACDGARTLRNALLNAHQRVCVHYAEENYQASDDDNRLVAGSLLEAEQETLLLHVERCLGSARALDSLLRDLAAVATADTARRRLFRTVWPAVMNAVLNAVAQGGTVREDHYFGARAFAAVVPRPFPTGREADVESVIRSAAEGWPTAGELAELIERWLPLAAGTSDGADALVGFLDTCTPAEQVARLPWVSRLVSADFANVANRSYLLPGWLEQLRASGLLDTSAVAEYQRLVDGLAAAGDSRALRLQAALEH